MYIIWLGARSAILFNLLGQERLSIHKYISGGRAPLPNFPVWNNPPLLLNISFHCFWCFCHLGLSVGGYYQGCLLFWWIKVKVAPQYNPNTNYTFEKCEILKYFCPSRFDIFKTNTIASVMIFFLLLFSPDYLLSNVIN